MYLTPSLLHSTCKLLSSILSLSGLIVESSLLHEAFDQWSTEYPIPPEDHKHFQHGWDELLYEHHFSSLLDSASDAKAKTCLLSVSSSESLVHGLVFSLYLPWGLNWIMSL